MPFMYFILLARRLASEDETCCQIKDITLTSCVGTILFPLLLYLAQGDIKRRKIILVLYDQKWNMSAYKICFLL
jgi:hypothetical protein